jgi:hypothetical protein
MFNELAFNLRQGGVISFHGISACAAVYVDIDKSGRQYKLRKIQEMTGWNFRRVTRLQSSDVPIFHNDDRGLNPFNGSKQPRGGDNCGHEEGVSSILFTRYPLSAQA